MTPLVAPPYADLPPLGGVCTFDEALRTGMGLEPCVTWLKRVHYVLRRLHGLLTAHITSEPIYELKTAYSHHAWVCAEHVSAIRTRVGEMREPPLGLEDVPHPALEQLCDEVRSAPTTAALLVGVYDVLVPQLLASCAAYRDQTNLLADAPSVRVLRFLSIELTDLCAFGEVALTKLVTAQDRATLALWQSELIDTIAAAGGMSGLEPAPAQSPPRRYSTVPFVYNRQPQRDARFTDPYNAGVNPEAFLHSDTFQPRDKALMLFYKRLREIDVPEMMASIIVETNDRPWEFSRAMSRQLWDEARHSLMGEVGFLSQGIDWRQIPVNFTWSLNLNTQLTPQERHAVLFFIEQGLMPKTGKRYEWEVGQASGFPLAGLFQDFDWADEVLHAQYGREWYVKGFGDLKAALDYGDRCWSKVMSQWQAYVDTGLTTHRNWWPELYQSACDVWGVTPDPHALSFHETYASVRADLKPIRV